MSLKWDEKNLHNASVVGVSISYLDRAADNWMKHYSIEVWKWFSWHEY